MIEIIHAIILGIVEGITEFLPISSTAHLLVSEKLIGFSDAAGIFTVVIQLGAIMAAAWYFRKDLMYIVSAVKSGDKFMRGFLASVLVGVLPAALTGLIVEKTIGLPDSLLMIATALILGGIAFIIVENGHIKKSNSIGEVAYADITLRRALYIGIGQCFALIPGVSRSGATIMGGLVTGLDRKTSTVFSFYLSIPIMLAASALKLIDGKSELSKISGGTPALMVGVICSFITALLAINWLLKYVSTKDFKPFAYYRIALGIIILVVLAVS